MAHKFNVGDRVVIRPVVEWGYTNYAMQATHFVGKEFTIAEIHHEDYSSSQTIYKSEEFFERMDEENNWWFIREFMLKKARERKLKVPNDTDFNSLFE